MILSLEQLTNDYKSLQDTDSKAVQRLEVLMGYTELEQNHIKTSDPSYSILELKKEFLQKSGVAQRTLNRWKKNYRERGVEGLKKIRDSSLAYKI